MTNFAPLRRAARTDKNQKEIVAALREVGASVQHLHALAKGCPDILVGFQGRNYLMEIKNGPRGRLTTDQERFFQEWQGQVVVVRNIEEAIRCLD